MPIGITGQNNDGVPLGTPLEEGYGSGTGQYLYYLNQMTVPIVSYYSNSGIKSSGQAGEGHWMDIYRNGQYQIAGVDYHESPSRGTGQTFIIWDQAQPAPDKTETIGVIVYRL